MQYRATPLAIYFIFAILSSFTLVTRAQVYSIRDTYVGNSFFEGFDFFASDDPTHGRINYLTRQDAQRKNLAYVKNGKFVMRVDYKNKVPSKARGRDSIRIQSRAIYKDSVAVLDLTHMPEGCATWPAYWTNSARGPWPNGGEIDIIEGANRNSRNLASLHSSPSCDVGRARLMTGDVTSTTCDANVNFNQGCGVSFKKPRSYGPAFNAQGGGWYVMQRSRSGIKIWYWGRNDPSAPKGVKNGSSKLVPDASWGLPEAHFPFTSSCDANHFDAHVIIFDTTLCGDYAGSSYSSSGCPGNCVDFVNNNPGAFTNAFWEINALRVYTP